MAEVSAGEAVVRVLRAAGIKRMYAVPGESFLEVLDAVEAAPDLTLVSTRHESGAAFMAEAEAKFTGVPAVAAGTRGVGAANLAIGVHTAMQDATPMVVLVGQVDTGALGREAFQEVDLPAFFRPITKHAATVARTERLPDMLARSIVTATAGRPGPVMLALPADILRGSVDEALVDDAVRTVSVRRVRPAVEAGVARELAAKIHAARAPVVIAGVGARSAREELVAFADRFDVGVYAAFRRQDVFPNDHPRYLGHLTLGSPPALLDALRDADLVLVLGARLDEVTTQGFRLPQPGTEVIHIDVDPLTPGAAVAADWAVCADIGAVLVALLAQDGSPSVRRDWGRGHGTYLDVSTPRRRPASVGVDPAAVLEAMRRVLPPDAVVASDAGNFSVFLHACWRYAARSQLAPVSGAMGYGVPAGIAAALVTPDRPVVVVAGDGGFLMTGQELETAVRLGVRLVVIVFRNGVYGTIAMHQLRSCGRTAGVAIGEVDLAGFARSLGGQGISVEKEEALDEALTAALAHDGVTLIDVRTDPDLTTPTSRLSALTDQRPSGM